MSNMHQSWNMARNLWQVSESMKVPARERYEAILRTSSVGSESSAVGCCACAVAMAFGIYRNNRGNKMVRKAKSGWLRW